jgi:actin-related protein
MCNDEAAALVIDNGSDLCKADMAGAGDDFPRAVFTSILDFCCFLACLQVR